MSNNLLRALFCLFVLGLMSSISIVLGPAEKHGPPSSPDATIKDQEIADVVARVHRLVNEFRGGHGLAPLTLDPIISAEASVLAPKWLPTNQANLTNACGLFSLCGCSTSACDGCIDDLENQSDRFSLCNKEISRAKISFTRIGHRLEVKVWEITFKSRLGFNRIFLFEPDPGRGDSLTFGVTAATISGGA